MADFCKIIVIDGGLVKGRHVALYGAGGLEELEEQGTAAAFAEAHIQMEWRSEANFTRGDGVARFGGGVREEEGITRGGREAQRHERGDDGYVAVGDGGDALQGSAEKCAGHRGEVEAANGGEDTNGVRRIGSVDIECTADDVALVREGGVGEAGAASDGFIRRGACERGENGGGGGGVADAHFADANDVYAVAVGVAHGVEAAAQGSEGLVARHGGAERYVVGASADTDVDETGEGPLGVNANIVDANAGADMPREDGHAGLGAGHLDGLNAGDGRRRDAHALADNAVVGGEDEDSRGLEPGAVRAEQASKADPHLLKAAKTAGGLGEAGLAALRGGKGGGVRRADGGKEAC